MGSGFGRIPDSLLLVEKLTDIGAALRESEWSTTYSGPRCQGPVMA